jgi:hypothetical protein
MATQETNSAPASKPELVGFVVAASEFHPVEIEKVRAAAKSAGFDPEIIKDVRPRNCFIRAARALVKQGVLEAGNKGVLADKLSDESEIAYQFSRRQVEDGVASYPAQAVIRFRKTSEAISVEGLGGMGSADQAKVHATVTKLFEAAGFSYSGTDLNNLVDRLFSAVTRRIMLRGAVYFVPHDHQSLVFKVRDFLGACGIKFMVFTVGFGEEFAVQDIFEAAAQDVMKNINTLRADVAGLVEQKDEQGKPVLTKRMAKARFKQLAVDLQHYKGIAKALRVSMDKILDAAGESGQALAAIAAGPEALVRALSSGRKVDPLAAILVDTYSESNGRLLDMASRINGKAPKLVLAESVAVKGGYAPALAGAPQV